MKYLYIAIIVLCWSVNPFLKKMVNRNILPIEFNLYSNSLIIFYLILVAAYKNSYENADISFNMMDRLGTNEIGMMVVVSGLTLIPSYLMSILNNNYSISGNTAVVQSLNIISTTVIGAIFMGETISLTKIGGIACTSLGIYLLQ
jgi:drug/metabolite transporter (DMT)-like permease